MEDRGTNQAVERMLLRCIPVLLHAFNLLLAIERRLIGLYEALAACITLCSGLAFIDFVDVV